MTNRVIELLKWIKEEKKIKDFDEIATKQSIILNLLNTLNWNVFSVDEVYPEYQVENRRVDYSLRIKNRDRVFIEVKKPKEDLENHQKQLLDYAFRLGVEIAVLTNGLTWWFYLPTKPGNWNSRKFYTIDISEQDTEVSVEKFMEFLSRQSVESGDAVKSAERFHKGNVRKKAIEVTLPEAWNKIVGEPDPLLVELLAEVTEKICGYKPEESDVKLLLKENQERILLDQIEDNPLKKSKPSSRGKKNKIAKSNISARSTGNIKIRLDTKIVEAPSIPKLYLIALKFLVDKGSIKKISIPWGFGSKRYFIFKGKNPVHPSGRPFFFPVSYGDYHMEAHVSRSTGIRHLKEFFEELGHSFELIQM